MSEAISSANREDEKYLICKWCLCKKTTEEVGILSEVTINKMQSCITKILDTEHYSKVLRSCNDCLLELLRGEDIIITCRNSQYKLRYYHQYMVLLGRG